MDGGRSGLEPLKLPSPWLRRLVVVHQLLRHVFRLGRCLSGDKIDRKALRVENGGNMSATRRVFHLLDSIANDLCVWKLDNPIQQTRMSISVSYESARDVDSRGGRGAWNDRGGPTRQPSRRCCCFISKLTFQDPDNFPPQTCRPGTSSAPAVHNTRIDPSRSLDTTAASLSFSPLAFQNLSHTHHQESVGILFTTQKKTRTQS